LTALGGGAEDFVDPDFVVDFAVVWALLDVAVGVAVLLVAGGAAAPLAAAPAPATVTIWAGGLLTLVLLPERPISTPIPMASNSVPMPAMSVALTGIPPRLDGRWDEGVAGVRCAVPSRIGTRGGPFRSPHSTQ
jgi:hypothetical protein